MERRSPKKCPAGKHRPLVYVPDENRPGHMLEVCLTCEVVLGEVSPRDWHGYDPPEEKIDPGELQNPRESSPAGVILWSGGLDCVALGIFLRGQGLDLIPLYGMHRANGGGTTRHELDAAADLADLVLGQELVIARGAGPGPVPAWLKELGAVFEVPRRLLPIPSGPRKDHRNRILLRVVGHLGLDRGIVAAGTLGYESEVALMTKPIQGGRELVKDISHAELQKHTQGELVTAEGLGLDKPGLIRAACQARGDALELLGRSWSCRGYFRKHCGGCTSCRSRVQALMDAAGEDPTVYKPGTWAACFRRSARS